MNELQVWAIAHKDDVLQCYVDANRGLIDGSIYWNTYILIDVLSDGTPVGCSTLNVNVNDAYHGNDYVWDIVYGRNAVSSYDLVLDALQSYGAYEEYFKLSFQREVCNPENYSEMSMDEFRVYAIEHDGLSEEQWDAFVSAIEADETEWFCEGEGAMDGYESAFYKALDAADHYSEEFCDLEEAQ